MLAVCLSVFLSIYVVIHLFFLPAMVNKDEYIKLALPVTIDFSDFVHYFENTIQLLDEFCRHAENSSNAVEY